MTNPLSAVQIQAIKNEIAELEQEVYNLLHPISMKEQEIYDNCVKFYNQHITLNNAVPAEEGCAEAGSFILRESGFSVPTEGIAGTSSLNSWYAGNPEFSKVSVPAKGRPIDSPTGSGNGKIEGHTGFFGEFNTTFPGDWEIYSNDSATGKFLRTWSYSRWLAYYHIAGALPVEIYSVN